MSVTWRLPPFTGGRRPASLSRGGADDLCREAPAHVGDPRPIVLGLMRRGEAGRARVRGCCLRPEAEVLATRARADRTGLGTRATSGAWRRAVVVAGRLV